MTKVNPANASCIHKSVNSMILCTLKDWENPKPGIEILWLNRIRLTSLHKVLSLTPMLSVRVSEVLGTFIVKLTSLGFKQWLIRDQKWFQLKLLKKTNKKNSEKDKDTSTHITDGSRICSMSRGRRVAVCIKSLMCACPMTQQMDF